MSEIIFLGTGGGRIVMTTQLRATGGFRLNLGKFKIHIDPGPGALVRAKQYNQSPTAVNCIIVTHVHADHSTDANVMIEAMSRGTTAKRGILITSESVVNSVADVESCLTKYHLQFPREQHVLKAGDKIELKEEDSRLQIEALKTIHSDPSAIGLKLKFEDKVISYSSDTEYFEGIEDLYKGSDILILNVLRPDNQKIGFHLCTDDAIKIIKKAKPKLAVITHFGMKIIKADTVSQAQKIEKETGAVVLAAEDGMKINIEESLNMLEQTSLEKFEGKK